MENNPPSKSVSFKDRNITPVEKSPLLNKSSTFSVHRDAHLPHPPQRTFSSIDAFRNLEAENQEAEGEPAHRQPTLDEVSEEIDGLIATLSSSDEKPEIPPTVEIFAKMVLSEIDKYDYGDTPLLFGQNSEQDTLLINSMSRISKLIGLIGKFSPDDVMVTPSMSLLTLVVQRAMMFMEEDFRILLEGSMNQSSDSKTPKSSSEAIDSDDNKKAEEEERNYPRIDEEAIANLRRIATAMISTGYETECCQIYTILRRKAFKEAMKRQEFEKLSIDEVLKMPWETLEGHIATWIKAVKYASKVLLPGEKRLCDSIFSDEHPSISQAMFTNLERSVVILFLNFAEAIAMTKRSAERLFKVLDIYETLTELISAMDGSIDSQESTNELRSEISSVRRRLGEAIVCIYYDLENLIKNDAVKNPVPGGAVHPLTRYTMNYLRYACDYKKTLEQIFSIHMIKEQHLEALEPRQDNGGDDNVSEQNPFAIKLMTVMNLLDANLEAKSKLYKDPSLQYIFLMNNGRYILQKIKESSEIHELVGELCRRKKSSELRGYHKSYQRETWSRVLQCLNQEGLQVKGKVQKPVLKERFKSFNQMFDEIHKTQSTWVVSDEQLQSELRVSISAVMIPAYRSFLARFGQHFTPGRQSEKYIKYQPEDIESTIEGLFDGNHQNLSMPQRKN